jgi:hypothetical protein
MKRLQSSQSREYLVLAGSLTVSPTRVDMVSRALMQVLG